MDLLGELILLAYRPFYTVLPTYLRIPFSLLFLLLLSRYAEKSVSDDMCNVTENYVKRARSTFLVAIEEKESQITSSTEGSNEEKQSISGKVKTERVVGCVGLHPLTVTEDIYKTWLDGNDGTSEEAAYENVCELRRMSVCKTARRGGIAYMLVCVHFFFIFFPFPPFLSFLHTVGRRMLIDTHTHTLRLDAFIAMLILY